MIATWKAEAASPAGNGIKAGKKKAPHGVFSSRANGSKWYVNYFSAAFCCVFSGHELLKHFNFAFMDGFKVDFFLIKGFAWFALHKLLQRFIQSPSVNVLTFSHTDCILANNSFNNH